MKVLCPTIGITFDSSIKVNPFALSHHESYEVNLQPTSYVGNKLRDNPNSDTTAPMILVVQAMHCLSCVFSNIYVTVKKTLRTTWETRAGAVSGAYNVVSNIFFVQYIST